MGEPQKVRSAGGGAWPGWAAAHKVSEWTALVLAFSAQAAGGAVGRGQRSSFPLSLQAIPRCFLSLPSEMC